MAIILNSKYQAINGKTKPLPTQRAQSSDEGLFSKLHLIQDSTKECSYGYHLNPLLPPVYRFSEITDETFTIDQTPSKFVLLGSGLEGFEEETRNELATCDTNPTGLAIGLEDQYTTHFSSFITVPSYDGAEDIVSVNLIWSSSHLSASWSMEVQPRDALISKPFTSTFGENYEKYSILDRTDGNGGLDQNSKSKAKRLGEEGDPAENTESAASPASNLPHSSPSPIELPRIQTLTTFQWSQASPIARWKLTASPATSLSSSSSSPTTTSPTPSTLVAEFIMDTSPKNRAQGSKGQLVFRDYYGREWEAVVLCSVGNMVDVRDEAVLDVEGEEVGERVVEYGWI
jgi:hypothetical protein